MFIYFYFRVCYNSTQNIDPTRRDLLIASLEQCIKSLFNRAVLFFKRSLSAPLEAQPSIISLNPTSASVSPETDAWEGWDQNARERIIIVIDRILEYRIINSNQISTLLVCVMIIIIIPIF